MIIIFIAGVFAVKCIFGNVAQVCFHGPVPSDAVMIAAGFEMVFEYFGAKILIKRIK